MIMITGPLKYANPWQIDWQMSNLENVDPAEVDLPPGALPGLVFIEAPFYRKDLTSEEWNDCRNLQFKLFTVCYEKLDRCI